MPCLPHRHCAPTLIIYKASATAFSNRFAPRHIPQIHFTGIAFYSHRTRWLVFGSASRAAHNIIHLPARALEIVVPSSPYHNLHQMKGPLVPDSDQGATASKYHCKRCSNSGYLVFITYTNVLQVKGVPHDQPLRLWLPYAANGTVGPFNKIQRFLYVVLHPSGALHAGKCRQYQVPPEFWQLTAAGNTGSGFGSMSSTKLEVFKISQSCGLVI